MAYSLDLQDYVPFDIQASPIEILVPEGLSFQWILSSRALAFVASNATRRVVDAWLDKMAELRRDWDPSRTVFMLNSFAAPDCVMTPYSRQRTHEVISQNLHLKVSSCTIIGRSATSVPIMLMSNAINTYWRSRGRNYINMVFHSHAEGVRWLQRRLAEYEASNQISTQNL
jgi:hypothetical protein